MTIVTVFSGPAGAPAPASSARRGPQPRRRPSCPTPGRLAFGPAGVGPETPSDSARFSPFLRTSGCRNVRIRAFLHPEVGLAVAVGDGHPAVLAEGLGGHPDAGGVLPALVLGQVDEPDDPADQLG